MRKKILGLILIIACIFLYQSNTIFTQAETQSEPELSINTLYPQDILDYQDLSNITNISQNNNYIAYTLDTNFLKIIHKTTRSSINVDDFDNIIEIKYVKNNQLLIVDYNNETNLGNIHILTLDTENIITTTNINSINISNLIQIDIFDCDDYVLVGLIKEISAEYTFELYKITNSTSLATPEIIDQYSNVQLANTYAMAINKTEFYVLFKNNNENNSNRILKRTHCNDTSVTTTNVIGQILSIDYYNYNNHEYLVASTMQNLMLISPEDYTNTKDIITNLSITDIEINNDTIYISDNSNKIIGTYTISAENNDHNLTQQDILISGAYNTPGRFDQVSNIFIQNNSLFISDTNNDRIQIIDENLECSEISDINVDLHPHSVLLDNNKNLYFVQNPLNSSTSAIAKYSINENNNYILHTTYTNYNSITLGLISDTTISNNNDIYIIDYSNNKLLLLNEETGLQEKYNFEFTTNAETKIEFLKSLNLIVLLNDNTIYLLNPLNLKTQTDPIIDYLEITNCQDITCDLDSIITLNNDNIGLVTISNSIMQISEKSLQNEHFSNLSNISYDINTQRIYAFDEVKNCIVYFDSTLTEDHFTFSQIKNNALVDKTNSPFAINVINNAIIYEKPYSLGSQYTNITNCIGIETYEDYYRVLFEYDNVLTIGFLDKSNTNIVTQDTSRQIKVITTNLQVPVYKYPTILKYENQAIITSYIPINTYIDVNYNSFPITIDGKQFYSYEIDGKIGYIFNADIVLADNTNITPLHHNNATIEAIGEEEIFIYDEDKTTILYTLTHEDGVYVESYDKNNEYTKIIYKKADLNTITGYVKTEYIQMDKLDNNRILLISIIILSIVILIIIITTYIIIKNKKIT